MVIRESEEVIFWINQTNSSLYLYVFLMGSKSKVLGEKLLLMWKLKAHYFKEMC